MVADLDHRLDKGGNRLNRGTSENNAAFHRKISGPTSHICRSDVGLVAVGEKDLGVKGLDGRISKCRVMRYCVAENVYAPSGKLRIMLPQHFNLGLIATAHNHCSVY